VLTIKKKLDELTKQPSPSRAEPASRWPGRAHKAAPSSAPSRAWWPRRGKCARSRGLHHPSRRHQGPFGIRLSKERTPDANFFLFPSCRRPIHRGTRKTRLNPRAEPLASAAAADKEGPPATETRRQQRRTLPPPPP
jgi:hypothetical protein